MIQITRMKNLTAAQFLVYLTALTVGMALAFPAIPWLRPIGILLVVTAGVAVRRKHHVSRRLTTLVVGCVLLIAAVIVGVMAPQESLQSYRPRTWYALTVAVIWVLAITMEYCRWRASHHAES